MKRLAFTLAEILITLGIIGVLAAMTIPSMINKTHKSELQTQLKKSYSTLMNATNQLRYDNGFSSFLAEYPPSYDARDKFITDIKPYLNAQICTEQSCGATGTTSGYLTINKNVYYLMGTTSESLLLNDGSTLRISAVSFNKIYMDINGYHKKPNRAGFDIFAFDLTTDGRISPATSECNLTGTNQWTGDGCTAYALLNKSPKNDGKDYWNDFLPN